MHVSTCLQAHIAHMLFLHVYSTGIVIFVGAYIERFREFLEDLCNKSEFNSDDRDEAEWLPLPLTDLRLLVNEITSIREKKLLHLVPVEVLVRLLKVLDHQIHRAEGLSIEECDNVSSIFNSFVLVYTVFLGFFDLVDIE